MVQHSCVGAPCVLDPVNSLFATSALLLSQGKASCRWSEVRVGGVSCSVLWPQSDTAW